MKTINYLITLFAIAAIAIGTSYFYVPKVYAAVAYTTQLLPVTERVQQAAPGMAYDFKLRRMQEAALQLRDSRARLDANRRTIEAKINEYNNRKRRSEKLLADAREVYRVNPDARRYTFIGKTYTPETFGVQIESIDQQSRAQVKSLETLSEARIKVDEVWRNVAAKESRLTADRSRLEASATLWETQNLLSGLDIEVDFAMYKEVSRSAVYELRTVDELLQDAEKLEPQRIGGAGAGGGMSDAARSILTEQ